jgi:tRNA threonylcarbamoyladenosine biosynthesis protein TsaB
MPTILALDTSSDNCSVSLFHRQQFDIECERAPRSHTQLIMPMLKTVLHRHALKMSDIDALAFGCGPGSFTGVRIAAGVAQGLAFGAGCPVYAISNLEALALQCFREQGIEHVLVAVDARMDEVYWSLCRVEEEIHHDGKVELKVHVLAGESVNKPELVDLSGVELSQGFVGIGSGFDFIERFPLLIKEQLQSYDALARPKAEAICELAKHRFQTAEVGRLVDAMPSYVRNTVTWKKLPGRE